MARYHYTECGLSDVWLDDVTVSIDEDGQEVYRIPNIGRTHRSIARKFLDRGTDLSEAEVRFLRTELDMADADLAGLIVAAGDWAKA